MNIVGENIDFSEHNDTRMMFVSAFVPEIWIMHVFFSPIYVIQIRRRRRRRRRLRLRLRKISNCPLWSKYTQPKWGTVREWIQWEWIVFLEYFNIASGTNPLPLTPIKLFDDIFTKYQICPLWSKYIQLELEIVRGWIQRGWIVFLEYSNITSGTNPLPSASIKLLIILHSILCIFATEIYINSPLVSKFVSWVYPLNSIRKKIC